MNSTKTAESVVELVKAPSTSKFIRSRYEVIVDGRKVGSVQSARKYSKTLTLKTVWRVTNTFKSTTRSVSSEFPTRASAVNFLVNNS